MAKRKLGLQKCLKLGSEKKSGDNRGIKISCQKPKSNVFTSITL